VLDDELIGRAEELEAVWQGLAGHPLVTVLGVAGMGKTRLAHEAAGAARTQVPPISTTSGNDAG